MATELLPPGLSKEGMIAEVGKRFELTASRIHTLGDKEIGRHAFYIEFKDRQNLISYHQLLGNTVAELFNSFDHYQRAAQYGTIEILGYYRVPLVDRDAYLAQFNIST